MFWPIWVVLVTLLLVLAILRGFKGRSEALSVILIGLLSMQISKHILHPDNMWIGAAFIWICAAGAVGAIQRQNGSRLTAVAVLLLASAGCIFAGRVFGEDFSLGSFALAFSDVFGLMAVASLGGPVFVGFWGDFKTGLRNSGLARAVSLGLSDPSLREATK